MTQNWATERGRTMSGEKTEPTGAESPAEGNDHLDGVIIEEGAEDPITNTPEDKDSSSPPPQGAASEEEETQPEAGEHTPEKREVNQEAVNKKFNRLTFEKHEALREKEAAERRAEELERKLAEVTQTAEEVEIPPLPDSFDADYEAKMKARDEAIAKKAQADADKAKAEAEKVAAANAAQEAIQKEMAANVAKMHESAKANGIKPEDLAKAEDIVAPYLPPGPDVARFLLEQDNADLIITHLSGSAEELVKISQMDPLRAAAYITSTVIPQAIKLKSAGASAAPPPLDVPSGRGAGESESPYLDGVSFE